MKNQRIVIMGASSGIGEAVAKRYINKGYTVGVCARREAELLKLQSLAPERVFVQKVDICKSEAPSQVEALIEQMGGMDLYFHSSGMGFQNPDLDVNKDLQTVELNTYAFTQMIGWAFRFFEQQGFGHLVAISSIAGTKGIGLAASYSASKAYQATFLQSLRQLIRIKHLDRIHITDIRPGFVATPLLKDDEYMMLMKADDVAQEIVDAVERKKSVRVIDWRYRILVPLWRMLPRFLWERWALKSSN